MQSRFALYLMRGHTSIALSVFPGTLWQRTLHPLTFALPNAMIWPSCVTSRSFSPQHHWVFPSFYFHNSRSRDLEHYQVSEKLALKPLFLLFGNERLIKLIKQHEAWFPSSCFCPPLSWWLAPAHLGNQSSGERTLRKTFVWVGTHQPLRVPIWRLYIYY